MSEPEENKTTRKTFKCPECGGEEINEVVQAWIITKYVIYRDPLDGIKTVNMGSQTQTGDYVEYQCANCENILTWKEIKEALEPKVNQLSLFPMSSPEPQTEDAKHPTTSNEEKPCATNVESDVSLVESSLNDTEKKTSTSATTVDTTTTDTNAPAQEDKEKTEP